MLISEFDAALISAWVALQLCRLSLCNPKSTCLRHLYLSDLSVTLSTVLSLSKSFPVFSDSKDFFFASAPLYSFPSAVPLGPSDTSPNMIQHYYAGGGGGWEGLFICLCFSFSWITVFLKRC